MENVYKRVKDTAQDIIAEVLGSDLDTAPEDHRDECMDRVHESCEWDTVIYTHKAIEFYKNENTDEGEQMVEDTGGMAQFDSLNAALSAVVFWEISARVTAEVDNLLDDLQETWQDWQDAKDEAEDAEGTEAEAEAAEAAKDAAAVYEAAVEGKTSENKGEAA